MGFLDRVRAALRGTEERLDRDLTRRERELAETPPERLARLEEEAAGDEDPFAEVREKLAAMEARAEVAGLADDDHETVDDDPVAPHDRDR